MNSLWYLDAYCWKSSREFPVNTYCHETLNAVVEIAEELLSQPRRGIDEVRISREPKGQSPQRLEVVSISVPCKHDGPYFIAENSQGTFCMDCGTKIKD